MNRQRERLERIMSAAHPKKRTQPREAVILMPEQRVQVLRIVFARMQMKDPWPDLAGRAYLEQFWGWWYAEKGCTASTYWPPWAINAVSRICGLPEERRDQLRCQLNKMKSTRCMVRRESK